MENSLDRNELTKERDRLAWEIDEIGNLSSGDPRSFIKGFDAAVALVEKSRVKPLKFALLQCCEEDCVIAERAGAYEALALVAELEE